MRQHSIDLLPDAVRQRNQAGLRTGRYVAGLLAAVIVVIVLATQARFQLDRAEKALLVAEVEANHVLEAEAKARELRTLLDEAHRYIDGYQELALPMDVSAVLATLVNQLPESVTLDRIDLDAGARRIVSSVRSKGAADDEEAPPRVLTGELAGFATSDIEIAELVTRLQEVPPFEKVSLDFSRTKPVRGRSAREFRLSFRIDLEAPYEIATPVAELASAGEESDHVQ